MARRVQAGEAVNAGQIELDLSHFPTRRRAVLSGDDVSGASPMYRYLLEVALVELDLDDIPIAAFCTFIMLNPSVADAVIDDPTLRKCKGFATRWGFGGIRVVNLYAYRATKPAALVAAHKAGVDIVGPENDRYIRESLMNSRYAVAAWGQSGPRPERVNVICKLAAEASVPLHAIRVNGDGSPGHPLMPSYSLAPKPWSPA